MKRPFGGEVLPVSKKDTMRKTLSAIVARHPATGLMPRAFMIAWHGVPTLVYQGFSPTLAGMKRTIAQILKNLPPEAPGSRWPKTTLGALPDARPLSPNELRRLLAICDQMTGELVASSAAVRVARLHWVQYECRSLERRTETVPMPMNTAGPLMAAETPDPSERQRVETILHEFSATNLAAYLNLVNREGHRIDHYRPRAIGRALVFDLEDQTPPLIDAFIAAVENVLPDRYVWFAPTSRHVTIRGMSK